MIKLTYTLLLSVLFTAFIFSCEKDATSPENFMTYYPDSIIYNDQHIKFFYDAQKRVIEERYQIGDTIRDRFVYEYAGTSTLPSKRRYYSYFNTTPTFINDFVYDNNGRKIMDSVSYFTDANYYQKTTFDYYAPNRIAINIEELDVRDDTVYITSNGRIDSIRSYLTSTNGQPKFHWYTKKFHQFDNQVNVFKFQNTSEARFHNFFPYLSYFGQFNQMLEYFHQNNLMSYSIAVPNPTLPEYNYQKQIQYNQHNLPEIISIQTSYPQTFQFRITYIQ